jgi:hypothetical protein
MSGVGDSPCCRIFGLEIFPGGFCLTKSPQVTMAAARAQVWQLRGLSACDLAAVRDLAYALLARLRHVHPRLLPGALAQPGLHKSTPHASDLATAAA